MTDTPYQSPHLTKLGHAPISAAGPERAARILKAKAAELEAASAEAEGDPADLLADVRNLAADVALVAELLAAHLDGSLALYAEPERRHPPLDAMVDGIPPGGGE